MTADPDDLIFVSAQRQAAAIAQSQVTSRDLLEAILDRVDRLNPGINAVVVRRDEAARDLADQADDAVRAGAPLAALHGVPMTVKECFEVAGSPTTAGAPEFENHVAASDAVVVSRLVGAGAIIYGKTNTPYMADDLQTYNEIYGVTSNPWDVRYSPGGSSGGSAAAISAGFTSLEMGSDIGGSVRNPAALCGVYGHKPTWGIVPLRGHVPGPPGQRSVPDLAVAGPLGVTADDLDVALRVVAGPDELDARGWSLRLPRPRRTRLRDFTVGFMFDHALAPISGEVGDVLSNAVDTLARTGVTVRDSLPDIDFARYHRLYLQLLYGQEANGFPASTRRSYDEAYLHLDCDDDSRSAMMIRGVSQRHRQWLAVNERRHRNRSVWADWFSEIDLLLCPATVVPAYQHDHSPAESRTIAVDGVERDYWDALFWAGLATASLLPATVLPAGMSASGFPVGLQAVGPYLGDLTTITFARLAESVLGGVLRPPGF